MKGMANLRETVARAMHTAENRASRGGLSWDECNHAFYLKNADAALAALGLDDLDAAVERGARRLVWEQHQGCVEWDDTTDTTTTGDPQTRAYAIAHASAVLEAALTATPESEKS